MRIHFMALLQLDRFMFCASVATPARLIFLGFLIMAIYSKRAWVSWVSRGRAPRSFCSYLVLPFFIYHTPSPPSFQRARRACSGQPPSARGGHGHSSAWRSCLRRVRRKVATSAVCECPASCYTPLAARGAPNK